ncbi:MAG: DUF4221 family protein [Lunatimonas sp.]|uniref:DUF4221 family protein n=1 Tax=Lunatimonas sp. TaxID=2060141 RepID=UPI00263B2026|nr:DUF4221 family protein [Lunatimonas sp.]MCC5936872.1 DUF4221 family protein [Lunatimonas sp.]
MKKIIFIIFLSLLSSGCKKKTQERHFKMEIIEEISIKTNDLISVNPGNTKFIETDSGTFLFAYNHVEKNYQFIDFSKGEVNHKIPLTFEGPNSVKGFLGATLTGADSIWLTFSPPAIGLINFKGELLLKRQVPNEMVSVTALITTFYKPIIQIGAEIYGPQPYFMDHHEMGKELIAKHQLVFSYSFGTESTSWHEVFYSNTYWDNGKKLTDYSWDEREEKIYIAPYYDHQIQVFDSATKRVVKRKEVKSVYVNRFNFVDNIPSGFEEANKNTLESEQYGPFIYDRFRDIFYRVFIPSYKSDNELSSEELRFIVRSRPYAGIMVLDNELNVLGEHLFDKFEIHTSTNMFVGEKGLYISLNNENHPDYDENHFRYRVVRFNVGGDYENQ